MPLLKEGNWVLGLGVAFGFWVLCLHVYVLFWPRPTGC
jgi:hypothetical protein